MVSVGDISSFMFHLPSSSENFILLAVTEKKCANDNNNFRILFFAGH